MANRLTTEQRYERARELGIIVDPEYEFVCGILSWNISTAGYAETTYYDGDWRKQVKLHHFIIGTPLDDMQVDHINRNKLDNRLCNLRIVDRFVNAVNRDYVDQSSNIRVTSRGNKYEVRIRRFNITHQVGTFNTLEEAIKARDDWYEIQSKNA